jgi:two-component system alkaline phosphatase synthesis response regulator PhoP
MVMAAAPAIVLVVDDEERLRELLRGYLAQAGFSVLLAADGPQALELARSRRPDLLVLDLMLPGIDGLEVCRQLRGFSDAYVLMLTARAEEIDRVVGLEVGADDYLTKPFSPRELVARVRAMLRRPRSGSRQAAPSNEPGEPETRVLGPLQIDAARHEVTLDGAPLALTVTEYGLLAALAAHPSRVLTRAQLLEQVWGADYFGDDHVVDVHIANLRRKLGEETAQPRLIETVRGVGYRLKVGSA